MTDPTAAQINGEKSPKDTFDELRTMVTTYAKQETVEPLKNLGKWVALGVGGAIFIGIGLFLAALGLLRLLQTRSWFDDSWTWIPYLIVFGALALTLGLTIRAMLKRPAWLEEVSAS